MRQFKKSFEETKLQTYQQIKQNKLKETQLILSIMNFTSEERKK